MEIDSSERTSAQFTNITIQEDFIEAESTEDRIITGSTKRRKYSFVWQYFRPLGSSSGGSLECIICASSVSNQTSNLARHLFAAHDINRQTHHGEGDSQDLANNSALGRTSRSFIWKYCTKEDCRYARCHLCNKLLYFGGGNTANITKHLRRKHSGAISSHELGGSKDMEDSEEFVAEMSNQMDSTMNNLEDEGTKMKGENHSDVRLRKERKGSSYVWNYCDKLSRHTIRCKLCKKVMSFHGTANVITHLQRRHNIVGRVENETAILNNFADEDNGMIDVKDEPESIVHRRRRSSAATSIVWKYCTRLGQDVVRCSFCKKNLSFQGTSNLQRHLHRMHGIVTQGRGFGELEQESLDIDDNFIWEHCEHTDDGKIKCNMCNNTFDEKGFEEIRRHLTVTHAVLSSPPAKRHRRRRRNLPEETCDETDEYEYDNDDDNWQGVNEEYTIEYNDASVKKDQPTFEDIIEEDHAGQINGDEDPFDPNVMHNYPVARPLSASSSHEATPDRFFKISADTNRLRKLNEERLRMETEYFREKAGYYRMQKYFTALQAKKVRLELDRLQNSSPNGTAYNVNTDMPEARTSTATIYNNQKK
ncbi:uncharacterized protein LOC128854948 [Anastrepha ludens]|uniref:uncharacterized protein LOC128854948 n=1 Tax=Anastrepha ludens TaxID=28586 RepID=UPI0023AF1D44|nr:uncharacterized protein LOC128854948 [Anastrepha ludens]